MLALSLSSSSFSSLSCNHPVSNQILSSLSLFTSNSLLRFLRDVAESVVERRCLLLLWRDLLGLGLIRELKTRP